MELKRRLASQAPEKTDAVNQTTFKPTSYKEMDEWINSFSMQAWTAIIGAYTAGGYKSVIEHMREKYKDNLSNWKDKDLRHFWDSHSLFDFKLKHERTGT